MVHSARSLGSAALNMCNVAEGGLDAYWEGGESLSFDLVCIPLAECSA